MSSLNWGIIGTGAIAKAFAHGLTQSKTGKAVAVGSRSQETAEKFGDEHDIPNRHASYEALLADDKVQAVYISTPHPFHPEWAIQAAAAGKHVLCEKPIALSAAEAEAMIQAARDNGVFFMEAFMYRCHPQTAKLVELIKSGIIGEVRFIRASFGFGGGDSINPESRLFSNALGGGGILDVGTYAVSASRLIAGAAVGKDFDEPRSVVAAGKVGETGVDEWAAGVLQFESGITAQVSTAVRAPLNNTLEVYGSAGTITVPNPWVANRKEADTGKIIVAVKGEKTEHECPAEATSFALEADVVANAVAAGKQQAASPAMSWADTMGNIQTLDKWLDAVGVSYQAHTQEHNRPARGELARQPDAPMRYGEVPGLNKKVAKFVMGCDNRNRLRDAAPVWDYYFEQGGNAFDTAYIYGGGKIEQALGQWIKARGVRDEVTVLTKGAHTPHCTPEGITKQLLESLERKQFDKADIYIMHRDNLDVPVGEFIDVLNEHVEAGRVTVFGGSNWTLERFAEANAYAKANGKQGMTVLSDNLSLARMVHPVWAGCVHVSDKKSRQWLAENNVTNFAWSSQARGYFLPEDQRMKLGADNFSKWDSPDNQTRRERAEELAKKKGCSAINIAAAYVIGQAFPSFALVGPRTIEEIADVMRGLDVELTAEEIDYLWGDDVA